MGLPMAANVQHRQFLPNWHAGLIPASNGGVQAGINGLPCHVKSMLGIALLAMFLFDPDDRVTPAIVR